MGLFSSLKGKRDVGVDDPTKQPIRDNSSSHDGWSATQEKRRLFGGGSKAQSSTDDQQYTPPSGPPPSQRTDGKGKHAEDFAPPPGPPPSHSKQHEQDTYAPPPGPPPSQSANPPPYHDWTVIPDTALLPPPPALPQDYSPSNNASYDSAERAHAWCAQNPSYTPSLPTPELHALANAGHLSLETPPPQLWPSSSTIRKLSPASYRIKTSKTSQDAIILSSIPLYFAAKDNPLLTSGPKTIYFEIRILNISNANSGIAIGYAGKPYPMWRLPGWHRASVGVHGDDGRRFVNDPWGGRDFVSEFKAGETIGVGMTFGTEELRTQGPEGRVKTRVFVTRGGKRAESDGWDVDEERDERDEGVDGLQGDGDLYLAIGVFGGVEFEVNLGREGWLWRPRD
ncbi:hypothetical protein LTR84_013122 [Exophiala bonariae]|uniref:SPRY domain-containing protein n=1 Tax=Exophiala bonariae TaxID=1690606 RepID=A0AAV9NDR5_9EURO|nr:hypothetical protein LTR84_013122 [Exophiala bonariae]